MGPRTLGTNICHLKEYGLNYEFHMPVRSGLCDNDLSKPLNNTSPYTYVCTYVYIYSCCACIYIHMCTYIQYIEVCILYITYIHTYICMYDCTYVRIYVCTVVVTSGVCSMQNIICVFSSYQSFRHLCTHDKWQY